jgi:hypothetical protein
MPQELKATPFDGTLIEEVEVAGLTRFFWELTLP